MAMTLDVGDQDVTMVYQNGAKISLIFGNKENTKVHEVNVTEEELGKVIIDKWGVK